jgi:hypothetical protein
MEARRVRVQADVAGAAPEQVLVLEVAGTVSGFIRAVRGVEGAEWLAEFDDTLEADEDFFQDEEHPENAVPGQLFLVMSDQRALHEILGLWEQWRQNQRVKLRRGLAPWKAVFAQLRDIRVWEPRDRIAGTGLEADWLTRVAAGAQLVPAEIELWFRNSADARNAAEERVRRAIEAAAGEVVAHVVLTEVAYHAVLADLPAELVPSILRAGDVDLIRVDDVMLLRPTGQAVVTEPVEADNPEVAVEAADAPAGDPLVALLDGLPLENHAAISGRLIVDDPDGWAAIYPAEARIHGTAMSSLIARGDLGDPEAEALGTPLYVRPILRPVPGLGVGAEFVPDDELFVDLVHRAVRRMFVATGGEGPAAPSVRIVNLSVCDRAQPFGRYPSAIARVVDWLAWEYGLLFSISAGNATNPLTFPVTAAALDALSSADLERMALRIVADTAHERRLLAPAESINGLTVGAAHSDGFGGVLPTTQRNVIDTPALASPVSASGLGFRRSVKPDVLAPGGRQLFRDVAMGGGTCTAAVVETAGPPGHSVATPGAAGVTSAMRYVRGTSNSAALCSQAAAYAWGAVSGVIGDNTERRAAAALLKSWVVHSASWSEAGGRIRDALDGALDTRGTQTQIARMLGYGVINRERLAGSTMHRVTLVGIGSLGEDLAHLYEIPLPPSLSGEAVWRRLTITLAWLSPINPQSRGYRRAHLWFDSPDSRLGVEREEVQWQAVRRGTVQHEIFEGERASVFADGDTIRLRVNCRADGGEFESEVPYGLAVTIEAAPSIGVSIYDEIATRLQQRIGVPIAP